MRTNKSSPPAISPFPLVEPTLRDGDLQTSNGLQDVVGMQDTTYATTSPLFLPRSDAYATTDIIAVVPIRCGLSLQAGVKNLLDRNYYHTAGYPEQGGKWFFNLRYYA